MEKPVSSEDEAVKIDSIYSYSQRLPSLCMVDKYYTNLNEQSNNKTANTLRILK